MQLHQNLTLHLDKYHFMADKDQVLKSEEKEIEEES